MITPEAMELAAEALPTILFAGKDLLLVDKNGEIIGEQSAPDSSAADDEIISYLGPRLKRAQARLAGLAAEKEELIDQINRHYDPQINQARGYISFLRCNYIDRLRDLASRMLEGARSVPVRSDCSQLKFRKKPGKTEITDMETALLWAKVACPDAIKTVEGILVSRIPADMELSESASGLRRLPAEDTFEVE